MGSHYIDNLTWNDPANEADALKFAANLKAMWDAGEDERAMHRAALNAVLDKAMEPGRIAQRARWDAEAAELDAEDCPPDLRALCGRAPL